MKKEVRGTVELPMKGHTPHQRRGSSSSMTPLTAPRLPCSVSSRGSGSAAVLCQQITTVVSAPSTSLRRTRLCSPLQAAPGILINRREMDQVPVSPPSALLILCRLNQQLQLKPRHRSQSLWISSRLSKMWLSGWFCFAAKSHIFDREKARQQILLYLPRFQIRKQEIIDSF